MNLALLILVAVVGLAVLLTLAGVNMLVFLALREMLKPARETAYAEDTGVADIDESGYVPKTKDEYEDRLSELMSQVDMTEEDLIAGLGL